MPRATYLFPAAGALAVFEGEDRLTIMEPATGWTSTLTGVLARDARALIDGNAEVPRLSALASNHVGVATLLTLASGPRLDDSPSTAIRLQGFGTLFLELVGQCNERCTHCYAGSGPEINQALPRATCEQIITDASSLGFSRVQFTGGDPLLCKFLPELVAHAKACGIPQREIYTNGLALSATLLEQLADSEPTFAFSFYSSDPLVHDAITNTPGSHRRTSDAIRRTVAKGLGVRAGVIAMESNAADVPTTVDYLRTLGVESVAVSPTFGVGRGTHFVSETPVAIGNSHGGNSHGGNTGDGASEGKLCVTYEGDVVPCIFNREMKLGSVYERSLLQIASDPDRQRRKVIPREQFMEDCRTGLQCSTCKLTACALHFANR